MDKKELALALEGLEQGEAGSSSSSSSSADLSDLASLGLEVDAAGLDLAVASTLVGLRLLHCLLHCLLLGCMTAGARLDSTAAAMRAPPVRV